MDSAATPATAIAGKKHAKPKKAAKEMTEDELKAESSKHAGVGEKPSNLGRSPPSWNEERITTNDRIIAKRQHASGEL
jgi:hypothetical protein